MRRIVTLLVPLAACAAISAGCGDDDGSATTSVAADGATATGSATATSGSSTGAEGDTVVVKLRDTAFDPQSTSVRVGTKVEWENEDAFDHNVVATSGGDFQSDDFGEGGTFEFTPEQAGTIEYVCTLHPGMTGTLTVTE